MAYEYQDPMGNYTGYSVDQEAEAIAQREEEERKRKEQEEFQRKQSEKLAKERDNLAVHKQEVTTYANGSKTITNVAEVPATANAPGRPNVAGPVAPDDYNASIAQQESGGNPNIGYHDRNKGSAYGPYGMTSAGYEDARKLNPSLPQDITQASPEQQTQAQNAYTQQNAKYLQNYGVEPTQQNLAAAHFLGAKGLSNYLKTGEISAQAAAANGGYDNAKRIVDSRLGGQPAPASGAVQRPGPVAPEALAPEAQQQPAPQEPVAPEAVAPASPYSLSTGRSEPGLKVPGMQSTGVATSAPAIDAYQSNQNDPLALMKLGHSDDANVPDWLKERSRNRAADLVTQQRGMNQAKEQAANMEPTEMAKYLRKKTEGGSYLKLFFYNMMGMDKSAAEESAKLGMGDDKVVMGADGKPYMVKLGINGTPIEGYNAESGSKLSAEELVKVAAGATAAKGVHQEGNIYKDPNGKIKGSFVLETRPGQAPVYKEVGTGRIATAEEGAALNKVGVAGTLENQLNSQRQKLQEQTRFMGPQEKIKFYGKFDAENGTNFLQEFQGQNPEYFTAGGGKVPAANGAVAPTPLPAGTQGAVQAPAGGPVAPGQAPAAPVANTPAAIVAARKQQEAEQAANTQVSVDARKDYNGYVDKEIVAKVPNATKISRIRSQQLDGPDGLLAVPEVAGIMAGGGGAGREVANIVRDMITGQFNSVEDLNKRVVGLGIQGSNPKVYNALMTQIRLQQELGPLTIKETAPVGAISDSEQKMNASNQVDPLRNPAYVTFNLLSKNKFQTDLTQAKADFAAKNPELNTIAKFNQAWTKEEGKLYKQYDDIYAARAAYVGEHKNTPLAAAAGYKLFPVPAWNSEAGTFEYKGQPYAKKRPAIDSFVK